MNALKRIKARIPFRLQRALWLEPFGDMSGCPWWTIWLFRIWWWATWGTLAYAMWMPDF